MTPESPDDEAVRRLLRAVGDQAPPLPEPVAQRLDAVLAELSAERSGATEDDAASPAVTSGTVTSGTVTSPAAPVDLAQRRRRRWTSGLVAAAVVGVVGVGLTNVLNGAGSMDAASTGAAESAEEAFDSGEAAGDRSGSRAGSDSLPEPSTGKGTPPAGEEGAPGERTPSLPKVSSTDLTAGARRVARYLSAPASASRTDEPLPQGPASAGPCRRPATRIGDRVAVVLLDGTPATLVLREERAGRRRVEVYPCDDPTRRTLSTSIAASAARE